MSPNFMRNTFLGLGVPYEKADTVLVGCPLDDTSSFRPGSRFAPNAIRENSIALETYSPDQGLDLNDDAPFIDLGNLDLPVGNKERSLQKISEVASGMLNDRKRILAIGGEHLISLPLIEETKKVYSNLKVIHMDAHTDMRDEYLGEKLSHATVMRRVLEVIGHENLYQTGIRSGTRKEFELIRENKTLYGSEKEEIDRLSSSVGKYPCYLSLDLDILDPGIFPATGTPEPGGLFFKELMDMLYAFKNLTVVGLDVVEYNPLLDPSHHCSLIAAKLIREMLLLFHKR